MIYYANITKSVMLKAGQIAGAADAADLETRFGDVLETAVEGVDVPLSALKLAVLASEKHIVGVIGLSSNNIARASLYGRTDDLLTGEEISFRGDGNKEFSGAFGNVRDYQTDAMLTEKPVQEIRRVNRLYDSGVLKIRPHHFHISGQLLEHTRDLAYVEGCLWDYETQSDEYDAQNGIVAGFSPLPQDCETAWIAHVLANLPQEGWLVAEGSYYADVYAQWERSYKMGLTPAPTLLDTTASSEAVKN